jgi:hypothetical protein
MDLSDSWLYLQHVAKSRLANNSRTPHHENRQGEGIELIGAAGELAARRFFGIEEKLHEHFDGGIDLVIANMRIDVKSTLLTPRFHYRFLQWPRWKEVHGDFILMMAVDVLRQKATVVGYATREEIKTAPINLTRSTPCHEIPVSDLHPAWELEVRATAYEEELIRQSTAVNWKEQAPNVT